MSKIIKKDQPKDVHSHNTQAYEFLDKHLPKSYVKLVQTKMAEKEQKPAGSSLIRNVRNQTNFRNDILLVLVEVAKENKENVEQIKTLIA